MTPWVLQDFLPASIRLVFFIRNICYSLENSSRLLLIYYFFGGEGVFLLSFGFLKSRRVESFNTSLNSLLALLGSDICFGGEDAFFGGLGGFEFVGREAFQLTLQGGIDLRAILQLGALSSHFRRMEGFVGCK